MREKEKNTNSLNPLLSLGQERQGYVKERKRNQFILKAMEGRANEETKIK